MTYERIRLSKWRRICKDFDDLGAAALRGLLEDETETAKIKSEILWQYCQIHDTEFTFKCPQCPKE